MPTCPGRPRKCATCSGGISGGSSRCRTASAGRELRVQHRERRGGVPRSPTTPGWEPDASRECDAAPSTSRTFLRCYFFFGFFLLLPALLGSLTRASRCLISNCSAYALPSRCLISLIDRKDDEKSHSSIVAACTLGHLFSFFFFRSLVHFPPPSLCLARSLERPIHRVVEVRRPTACVVSGITTAALKDAV